MHAEPDIEDGGLGNLGLILVEDFSFPERTATIRTLPRQGHFHRLVNPPRNLALAFPSVAGSRFASGFLGVVLRSSSGVRSGLTFRCPQGLLQQPLQPFDFLS